MTKQKKNGYIEKFLKKADQVLDEAVELGAMTVKQASKTSKEFHTQAKKEGDALQKKGMKRIVSGISTAKNIASNSQEDLIILEKLGKLRKAGIITEREFQAKKKMILGRI